MGASKSALGTVRCLSNPFQSGLSDRGQTQTIHTLDFLSRVVRASLLRVNTIPTRTLLRLLLPLSDKGLTHTPRR